MAKTGLWISLLASILVFAGMLAVGCEPSVPAAPAYDTDVRPIFMSHCVRCHGAGPDGGALNTATDPTGPNAKPLTSDPAPTDSCYLNQYPDTLSTCPSGADGGSIACIHNGAYFCGTTLSGSLELRLHGNVLPMPPPPAPRLDDWELKVIDAWVAEKPFPLCSRSAHPDPTICPPADAGAGQ